MVRGGARRVTALALVLRLLLGHVAGPEAATTPAPTQTSARAHGPRAGSCSPTDFQCHTSGYCVPLTWRCDGDQDCQDGSDERECGIKPCARNRSCLPASALPCSCDNPGSCPGGPNKNLRNCSRQPCPAGQMQCMLGDACVPHTWRCDGHRDCPDSSDELGCEIKETIQEGNSTTMGTPATLDSVTSLRNGTASSAGAQPGTPSAYGVIAAAGLLGAILATVTLFMLARLRARRSPGPLGLLASAKESLSLWSKKPCCPEDKLSLPVTPP